MAEIERIPCHARELARRALFAHRARIHPPGGRHCPNHPSLPPTGAWPDAELWLEDMRHPVDDAFAAEKVAVMTGRVGTREEFMGSYFYTRGKKKVRVRRAGSRGGARMVRLHHGPPPPPVPPRRPLPRLPAGPWEASVRQVLFRRARPAPGSLPLLLEIRTMEVGRGPAPATTDHHHHHRHHRQHRRLSSATPLRLATTIYHTLTSLPGAACTTTATSVTDDKRDCRKNISYISSTTVGDYAPQNLKFKYASEELDEWIFDSYIKVSTTLPCSKDPIWVCCSHIALSAGPRTSQRRGKPQPYPVALTNASSPCPTPLRPTPPRHATRKGIQQAR